MTLSQPQSSPTSFDVRRYILAVARAWRLILIATVIAAVIAGAAGEMLRVTSSVYRSETVLVLTGARYAVRLDDRFTTTEVLPSNVTAAFIARQDEIKAVANSPDVHRKTRELVDEAIGKGVVSSYYIEVDVKGTLVTIRANAATPQDATLLAKIFAETASARLESVYGADAEKAQFTSEIEKADRAYQDATKALNTFVASSKISQYGRDLDQKLAIRSTLAAQQSAAIAGQAGYLAGGLAELGRLRGDVQALRADLAAVDGPAAPGQALSLLELQQRFTSLGTQSDTLATLILQQQLIQGAIRDRENQPASPLATPVPPNLPSPATSAQIAIESQKLVPNPQNQTSVLQIDVATLPRGSRQDLLRDVDGLIAAIDRRSADLSDQLTASNQPGAMVPGVAATGAILSQLDTEIATLTGLAREEASKQQQLLAAVQQAQTIRTLLQTKIAEGTVGAAAGGKVTIVSSPNISIRVSPPSLPTMILAGAIAGAAIGVIVALVLEALVAFGIRRQSSPMP